MAAFRRRPITIGNTRPTGLDNLAGGSRERYPPKKGDRSGEERRGVARPHASLAVNSDKDYPTIRLLVTSYQIQRPDLLLHYLEDKATGDKFHFPVLYVFLFTMNFLFLIISTYFSSFFNKISKVSREGSIQR